MAAERAGTRIYHELLKAAEKCIAAKPKDSLLVIMPAARVNRSVSDTDWSFTKERPRFTAPPIMSGNTANRLEPGSRFRGYCVSVTSNCHVNSHESVRKAYIQRHGLLGPRLLDLVVHHSVVDSKSAEYHKSLRS